LEAYSDDTIYAAIAGAQSKVFIWDENTERRGFCWLTQTAKGTKVEDFGVKIQGHGVGSRFFGPVLDAVIGEDLPLPIWLPVAADNSGAIRFYKWFGFVHSTLRKSVWHRRKGPIADALIMVHAPDDTRVHD